MAKKRLTPVFIILIAIVILAVIGIILQLGGA